MIQGMVNHDHNWFQTVKKKGIDRLMAIDRRRIELSRSEVKNRYHTNTQNER